MSLDKIKHGERVLAAVNTYYPASHDTLARKVSLDSKTVQKALADLYKAGYIAKDSKGFWCSTAAE